MKLTRKFIIVAFSVFFSLSGVAAPSKLCKLDLHTRTETFVVDPSVGTESSRVFSLDEKREVRVKFNSNEKRMFAILDIYSKRPPNGTPLAGATGAIVNLADDSSLSVSLFISRQPKTKNDYIRLTCE